MTTLHVTRGLPGSGKSTWAGQWVADDPRNRSRVNRDDLRMMLYGERWGLTYDQEEHVTSASRAVVREHLRRRLDVVADDTNLRPKYVREWRKLAAREGAGFEVHEFTIDIGEAITRDAQRTHPVGEDAIRHMAGKFLPRGEFLPVPPESEPDALRAYVRPEGKPTAVIVDIDGTVALMGARSPYDTATVDQDQPHTDIIDVVVALSATVDHVVFLSGRDEQCRETTVAWLRRHIALDLTCDWSLWMRPSGDRRRDSIVKAELFDANIRAEYSVLVVLDDRKQVVDMWRALGLTCLQVAEGNF